MEEREGNQDVTHLYAGLMGLIRYPEGIPQSRVNLGLYEITALP